MKEENIESNERVKLLSQMIGLDPKFWPNPIPRNLQIHLMKVSEGYIKFQVTVSKDWLNGLHIMHGGIMVTLMDEAMGVAGFTLNMQQRYATIDLNVDYISSAREGEVLLIHGKIEKSGKQLLRASAYIETESGKLISKSTSNLLKFEPKQAKS